LKKEGSTVLIDGDGIKRKINEDNNNTGGVK